MKPLQNVTKFRSPKELSKKLTVTPQCDKFCKTIYATHVNRTLKRAAKQFKSKYVSPTRNQSDMYYHDCRTSYCNEGCYGITPFFTEIKNGFEKKYTKKMIAALKRKGAISGCKYEQF